MKAVLIGAVCGVGSVTQDLAIAERSRDAPRRRPPCQGRARRVPSGSKPSTSWALGDELADKAEPTSRRAG